MYAQEHDKVYIVACIRSCESALQHRKLDLHPPVPDGPEDGGKSGNFDCANPNGSRLESGIECGNARFRIVILWDAKFASPQRDERIREKQKKTATTVLVCRNQCHI